MSSATYRTVLRTPGCAAFYLTASAGRVGIAMTSLGIVWLVHGATDSYAIAGLVTGGFAVTEALIGPQVARLMDRYGQTKVLPPVLLVHAAAVVILLALVGGGAPNWAMTAGGALVGASIPQLGALSAARWAAALRADRSAELPTAFALESLANGVGYLAGPALVSTLGAFGQPALGSGIAGGLIVVGGLVFAAQRRTAPPPATSAAEHSRAGRTLLRPGFAVLVGLNLAIGVYFGSMQVSVTAFAVGSGVPEAAAPILAVSSFSGLLAGWLYGMRRWRTAPRVQLVLMTVGLSIGGLLLLATGSPVQLGMVMVLTGGTIPPILVLFSVLTESTVHQGALTQAFTWLNSASAAGSAIAAALAGQVVDAYGGHSGFVVAAAAAILMVLVSTIGLRALGQRVPRLANRPGRRGAVR